MADRKYENILLQVLFATTVSLDYSLGNDGFNLFCRIKWKMQHKYVLCTYLCVEKFVDSEIYALIRVNTCSIRTIYPTRFRDGA